MSDTNESADDTREPIKASFSMDADGAWIDVKGFAVRIQITDQGIVTDIYARGMEENGPMASTYAFDHEIGQEESA